MGERPTGETTHLIRAERPTLKQGRNDPGRNDPAKRPTGETTRILMLLSRSITDHHLRCGGWLNFEFSKRGKTFGMGHYNYLQEAKQRHAKTHTSEP